jgi:hypothetical protein
MGKSILYNKQNKYININNLLGADDIIKLKKKEQAFMHISRNDLKLLCPVVYTVFFARTRYLYKKKFWIRKKWTCAVYIRKVWEVNQM